MMRDTSINLLLIDIEIWILQRQFPEHFIDDFVVVFLHQFRISGINMNVLRQQNRRRRRTDAAQHSRLIDPFRRPGQNAASDDTGIRRVLGHISVPPTSGIDGFIHVHGFFSESQA